MRKKIGCYDCGLVYGEPGWVEAVIPDAIWNEIRPENASEGGGILCITCICRRLKKAGYDKVPCFLCGTEPIIALPEDGHNEYSLRTFITRHWKQKRVAAPGRKEKE
jgi:hypothetical protein